MLNCFDDLIFSFTSNKMLHEKYTFLFPISVLLQPSFSHKVYLKRALPLFSESLEGVVTKIFPGGSAPRPPHFSGAAYAPVHKEQNNYLNEHFVWQMVGYQV